jgi:hypothetical protein
MPINAHNCMDGKSRYGKISECASCTVYLTELKRRADMADELAVALESVLDSDMAMMAEDEGRIDSALESVRVLVAKYREQS